ncbi:MAG: hypothetical protein WCK11_03475 [Candidatus Falkowbacteria bacterium]
MEEEWDELVSNFVQDTICQILDMLETGNCLLSNPVYENNIFQVKIVLEQEDHNLFVYGGLDRKQLPAALNGYFYFKKLEKAQETPYFERNGELTIELSEAEKYFASWSTKPLPPRVVFRSNYN